MTLKLRRKSRIRTDVTFSSVQANENNSSEIKMHFLLDPISSATKRQNGTRDVECDADYFHTVEQFLLSLMCECSWMWMSYSRWGHTLMGGPGTRTLMSAWHHFNKWPELTTLRCTWIARIKPPDRIDKMDWIICNIYLQCITFSAIFCARKRTGDLVLSSAKQKRKDYVDH